MRNKRKDPFRHKTILLLLLALLIYNIIRGNTTTILFSLMQMYEYEYAVCKYNGILNL